MLAADLRKDQPVWYKPPAGVRIPAAVEDPAPSYIGLVRIRSLAGCFDVHPIELESREVAALPIVKEAR